MQGLDSWLEAPYTDAARRGDAYVEWCEENDLDADEDHWDAFDQALEAEADDYASEVAERRAEEAMEYALLGE